MPKKRRSGMGGANFKNGRCELSLTTRQDILNSLKTGTKVKDNLLKWQQNSQSSHAKCYWRVIR